MATLTSSGTPTFNADSTCTIDSTDLLGAPTSLLTANQGWVAARVKPSWASTSPPGLARIFEAGGFQGYYNTDGWNLDDGASILHAVNAHSAGDQLTLIYAWITGTLSLSINGAAFTTHSRAAVGSLTEFSLGNRSSDAARPFTGDFYWVAAGTGTLSDANASTIHGFGNTDPTWVAIPDTPTFLWTANSTTYATDATVVVVGARAAATATGRAGSLSVSAPTTFTGTIPDVMNRNPLVASGTVTLSPSLLTVDTNRAATFDGTTNSAQAADSTSLSIVGSMSMECLFKVSSLPGTTKDLVTKSSSFALQLDSTGHLLWHLDSGAGTVTITSASTISTGTAYHVVGVYNGNYAGATTFGRSTIGTTTTPILGDFYQGSGSGHNNKMATKVTLQEQGLLTTVTMDILRTPDATLMEYVRAHVYSGATAATAVLVDESTDVLFNDSAWPARAWATWTVGALAEAGTYWVGPAGGESSQAFSIGCQASGGTSVYKNDLLSDGLSATFGTPGTTDAKVLAAYVTYTPTARTGYEGNALLYINGSLNTSGSYTLGIADNANALQVAPSVAVTIDEFSVWNRVLKPVEIATHYTAR